MMNILPEKMHSARQRALFLFGIRIPHKPPLSSGGRGDFDPFVATRRVMTVWIK
jgi:hypothetical protein